MTINGLENNYYLSGNDIWLQVFGFGAKEAVRLELYAVNLSQQWDLQPLYIYPDPQQLFRFNVSLPIRALQPEPDHTASPLNTMQLYSLRFTVLYTDGTNDIITLTKYFIRGGRDKAGSAQWHLESDSKLIVGKWTEWQGVLLPMLAKRILTDRIVDFMPSGDDVYKIINPNLCDYRLIKFRNSLGGYQFWLFESWEEKTKVKPKKTLSRIATQLSGHRHRNIGTVDERELLLKTKTPGVVQEVIDDLIKSPEILLYDPAGTDNLGRWHRMQLESNDSVHISTEKVFTNELSFTFPNYINRDL